MGVITLFPLHGAEDFRKLSQDGRLDEKFGRRLFEDFG